MIRVVTRKLASLALLALLLLPATAVLARDKEGPSGGEIKEMIEFGIKLGKQGLWKEALYRWRAALRYDPENPKLLNNIAVALESQGDLEGARETYQQAQELAGRAKYIERNIEDFEELFTALEQYEAQYRTPPPEKPEGEKTAGDGEAVTGETPEDGQTAAADTAVNGSEAAEAPESESPPPAPEQPEEEEE